MPTKEELIQRQGEIDRARIDNRKKIIAQMNSPKQQRFFEMMGIRLKNHPLWGNGSLDEEVKE